MSYDVFLSRSHVDKEWTQELQDWLAGTECTGRSRRVSLEQEILKVTVVIFRRLCEVSTSLSNAELIDWFDVNNSKGPGAQLPGSLRGITCLRMEVPS